MKVKCIDCGYEDEQEDSGGPCPKCPQGWLLQRYYFDWWGLYNKLSPWERLEMFHEREGCVRAKPLQPFPIVDPLTGWFS